MVVFSTVLSNRWYPTNNLQSPQGESRAHIEIQQGMEIPFVDVADPHPRKYPASVQFPLLTSVPVIHVQIMDDAIFWFYLIPWPAKLSAMSVTVFRN